MSFNTDRNCEYFLISGFNKTRQPYDLSAIYNQGEEICIDYAEKATDFFRYKMPIIDIQIVHMTSRQRISDKYIIIDRTYSKLYKADLNGKMSPDELYICFRYGRDLSPITDIRLISHKQMTSLDQSVWKVIQSTVAGQTANLNSSSSNPLYIAYRRAPINAPVDHLVVTDICIIIASKHEPCPPAYTTVPGLIKRSPISHSLNICYKKSVVKQHVLTFQPQILYCLSSTTNNPIVDVFNDDPERRKAADNLPDDIRNVADFCMPWGATLESWSSQLQSPRPSFITFVLTNMTNEKLYGAAMLFYEDYNEDDLTDEEASILELQNNDMRLFASKSISILSRFPLFQTFNSVLSFLIDEDQRQRSSLLAQSSEESIPLERFISQFLYSVPFPTPDAPLILLQWDYDNPISIRLPTDPMARVGASENLYMLLRLLDPEQIIELFTFMLTEQRILLTSTCNSDLTRVAEALSSMIFPFQWSVTYIPFLYLGCIHIIQSPSPYLIGVDSRFFDYFLLPEGVGCIDLINKSIKSPDLTYKCLDYKKVLPKNVIKSLRSTLSSNKIKIENLEKGNTMRKSETSYSNDYSIMRAKEELGESIRECFLRSLVLMFKNYQNYLMPLGIKPKDDNMFDTNGFLKSVERNSRPLYSAIFDTQMWIHFICSRSYVTDLDNSFAFFDRCIKYVEASDDDQINLSALLQSDSIIKCEHTRVVPLPDPVDGWYRDSKSTKFPDCLDSRLIWSTTKDCEDDNSRYVGDTYQASSTSHSNLDASIPVIQIRLQPSSGGHIIVDYPSKTSVLRRPFEEIKQARQIGKEARRGAAHAWAGHVLMSVYCMWYVTLPGLIGYIEDTPALSSTGLVDRVLELAIEMLDTIGRYRFLLPDQLCLRVLLMLVHQLRPSRICITDVGQFFQMNVFSFGLCNQILLEEDRRTTDLLPYSSPRSPASDTSEGAKDEYDDFKHSSPVTSMDGEARTDPSSWLEEPPQVRSLLHKSTVDLSTIDAHQRHHFFEQSTNDDMSLSTTTKSYSPPIIASQGTLEGEKAIIMQRPRSEMVSELQVTLRKDQSGSGDISKETSQEQEPSINGGTDSGGMQQRTNRSQSSFRRFTSSANKSFRSVRRFMTSLGTEMLEQLSNKSGGLPATSKPWDDHSGQKGTVDRVAENKVKGNRKISIRKTENEVDRGQSIRRPRDGGIISPDNRKASGDHIDTSGSPIIEEDQIWEKITASLEAVRLPIGRYWQDEELGNGQPMPSIECSHSISVVMTTSTDCPTCHWLVYDDDIMNGWSYDDSDLRSLCPYCEHRFSPTLAFKVFVNHHNRNVKHRDPKISTIKRTKLAYKSEIIYLSPFVLRKELETVLQKEGEQALLSAHFLQRHSILYWNLILYYHRLSLPSHLFSFVTFWLRDNGRRLTGMRENIAKCDILIDLTGHEKVVVSFLLEMDSSGSNTGPAAYRRYRDEERVIDGSSSRLPSYTALLDQVVTALYKYDMRHAIELMLALRSSIDCDSTDGDENTCCQRATYRELMHLAILVLGHQGLNLETFHFMFQFHWNQIIKDRQWLPVAGDKPSSDSSFYCRQVFRPPLL